MKSEDMNLHRKTESESDQPLMCLSASCYGGSHPGAGGIHISYSSPPPTRVSNCSCSVSSTSSVGSSGSTGMHNSMMKRKNSIGDNTHLISCCVFEDSPFSDDDVGSAACNNNEYRPPKKVPRSPTKMTSPNALRKKCRKRYPSQNMCY